MEPMYLDNLQEDEGPSRLTESNASNEATRDATRLLARTSKVQWKSTDEDPQQAPSSSSSSPSSSTSQQEDLSSRVEASNDISQDPATDAGTYKDIANTKETDFRASKPLSRARICLEDSLSELKILVGHIQASSYVFHDLHLFTSSYPREKKKHPSPVLLRWPSTGKERSWPNMSSNWQHRHLYDSPHEDLVMRSQFSLNTKSEPSDKSYDMITIAKQPYETSPSGRQTEVQARMEPLDLQTLNQDQSMASLGEQGIGINQANRKSLYNKAEPDTLETNGMLKSIKKQARSSDATEDVRELYDSPPTVATNGLRNSIREQVRSPYAAEVNSEAYIERGSQPASANYDETENDAEASMQPPIGMRKSTMMTNASLSRQASARASRAVAFRAQPDITSTSVDAASSQIETQPQAPLATQSGGLGRSSMSSQPRSSQTEFLLTDNQPRTGGQGISLQYQNSRSFITRPSRISSRKSNAEVLGHDQFASSVESTQESRERDIEAEKGALALPNSQDYDRVNLDQNYDDEDQDVTNPGLDDQSQYYQQTSNLRKSTSNLKGGDLDASQKGDILSQQGDIQGQTYQITNQDTSIDPRKSVLKQRSSLQLDASASQGGDRKIFAARPSQYTAPVGLETRKSVAANRQSQDANIAQPDIIRKSLAPDTRKSVVPDMRKSIVPDIRKSVAPITRQSFGGSEANRDNLWNQQNRDLPPQLDARSLASRPSSSQQPSASASFAGSARQSMRAPNASTGELRKSVYQGPNNEEPTSQGQTSSRLSEADSYQEGEDDSLDTTSSESSSSRSSVGSPEVAPAEPFMSTAEAITRQLSRSGSTNSQSQPRISSVPARPSSFDGYQPRMRPGVTRAKSQSYVTFDAGNARGPDESTSVKRQSQ